VPGGTAVLQRPSALVRDEPVDRTVDADDVDRADTVLGPARCGAAHPKKRSGQRDRGLFARCRGRTLRSHGRPVALLRGADPATGEDRCAQRRRRRADPARVGATAAAPTQELLPMWSDHCLRITVAARSSPWSPSASGARRDRQRPADAARAATRFRLKRAAFGQGLGLQTVHRQDPATCPVNRSLSRCLALWDSSVVDSYKSGPRAAIAFALVWATVLLVMRVGFKDHWDLARSTAPTAAVWLFVIVLRRVRAAR
jgi:hypothetical protein